MLPQTWVLSSEPVLCVFQEPGTPGLLRLSWLSVAGWPLTGEKSLLQAVWELTQHHIQRPRKPRVLWENVVFFFFIPDSMVKSNQMFPRDVIRTLCNSFTYICIISFECLPSSLDCKLYEIKYGSPLDNQLLSTLISKEDTLNICEMKRYIRRNKLIAM